MRIEGRIVRVRSTEQSVGIINIKELRGGIIMIAEKMKPFVQNNSAIRMMFEEGNCLRAKYGADKVYDFSLGNPSVPAPDCVREAIIDLVNNEEPTVLHGYMNNAGFEDVRETIEKTGNRLVETMSEILRGITGGECRELLIDEDFHIRVDTGSDLVSIENLRLITVGQIYLSLRLAMGEILCGAEKLPVLLEEMFGAYDLENAAQTVTWLTGDQRQVIVSTGKKKELEILKNTGIACNTITI